MHSTLSGLQIYSRVEFTPTDNCDQNYDAKSGLSWVKKTISPARFCLGSLPLTLDNSQAWLRTAGWSFFSHCSFRGSRKALATLSQAELVIPSSVTSKALCFYLSSNIQMTGLSLLLVYLTLCKGGVKIILFVYFSISECLLVAGWLAFS